MTRQTKVSRKDKSTTSSLSVSIDFSGGITLSLMPLKRTTDGSKPRQSCWTSQPAMVNTVEECSSWLGQSLEKMVMHVSPALEFPLELTFPCYSSFNAVLCT